MKKQGKRLGEKMVKERMRRSKTSRREKTGKKK